MRYVRIGREGVRSSRLKNLGTADWQREPDMKTDQLINILSTNLEPAKRGQVAKTLTLAPIVGGAAAFCVILGQDGLRRGRPSSLIFLAVKLFLTLPPPAI